LFSKAGAKVYIGFAICKPKANQNLINVLSVGSYLWPHMNTRMVYRRRVRQALTILLLLIAVSTMLLSQHPRVVWWSAWVALGYLLLAMVLLIFNQTRLMFVCLGCSAAICLFFNETKAGSGFPQYPGKQTPALEKNMQTEHESPPASQ